MALLMDTSVLVDMERRGGRLGTLTTSVPEEELYLCAIVAAELLSGVERADHPARRANRLRFVEGLLGALPVLPFDLLAARSHAVLSAEVHRRGALMGAHDLMIGATALSRGMGVLTANVGDFVRIPGLRVVRPSG